MYRLATKGDKADLLQTSVRNCKWLTTHAIADSGL